MIVENKITIKEAAAEWLLTILPSEPLPNLAQEWLCQFPDSKTLLDLAICDSADYATIEVLFLKVIGEFLGEKMSIKDALKIYASNISNLMLNNSVLPEVGARKIWMAIIKSKVTDFHELDSFIYSASEIEDRPDERDFFRNEIVKEARNWAKIEK